MFFDQFVDGEFERAGIELFLQGNGDHDDLIVRIRLVSCHKILRIDYSTVSTVCVIRMSLCGTQDQHILKGIPPWER